MSNENAEVQSFFAGYEAANAIFDVEQIAACYADVFLFGGPEGVQCVKKEDFLKVLPRRKEFFRSRGLVSSNIDSLEVSTLDSKYTLVKVLWTMRFDRGASEPYTVKTLLHIFFRNGQSLPDCLPDRSPGLGEKSAGAGFGMIPMMEPSAYLGYSVRSAVIGSTHAARQAGIMDATRAPTPSNNVAIGQHDRIPRLHAE